VCAIAAVTALALAAAPVVGVRPVAAQVIPKSLQQGAPRKDIRETKNAWTVGIVGGLASGTYMRFAVDWRGRSTMATISVFCRSSRSAPLPTSTICFICAN
jgi:hypothetical protein